ncbi:regulatory protein SipA [Leptolyngbyaceae cyanobacterium UHCC 1019]
MSKSSVGDFSVNGFSVGDRVRLISAPPYVKTADPMPTLRSAELIAVGEEGTILDRRPGNYWSVRFANGAFLLDSQYLERV